MVFTERIEYLKKIVALRKQINNEVEEKKYNEILMNQDISNIGLQFNKPILEQVDNTNKDNNKVLKEILYNQDNQLK